MGISEREVLIKRSPGQSLPKRESGVSWLKQTLPTSPEYSGEEHQGIRASRKLKSKTNEKQNKRSKLSIFHRLTPLFSREGQG